MDTMDSIKRLKACYKKLPSVGEKTAERLAYASLGFKEEQIDEFIDSFKAIRDNVHVCPKCGMYIDTPFCPICDDKSRDMTSLLIVSDMKDVISFERTKKYFGMYFILGGLLSPLKGVDAEALKLPYLKELIKERNVKEVILATSSTLEGETTALYINKYLSSFNLKITRLAYGLPVGADLEYVDGLTIERSFNARTDMKGN